MVTGYKVCEWGILHALHLPVYISDKHIFLNTFLHHSACDTNQMFWYYSLKCTMD